MTDHTALLAKRRGRAKNAISCTRSTKKPRRGKAAIQELCDAMYKLCKEEHPLTIRHVFYRMSILKLVKKLEGEYKGAICRLLTKMRKGKRLPFHWITDNTRWRMKPNTYSSLGDALDNMQRDYRRALWDNQNDYIEVWTEKDAISSILYPITSKWDVPLMTARGYCSQSFLYSVAEDITQIGKPTYLYYFGDHDPSGVDARRFVEETIRKYAPDAEVHFELVAVTREKIDEWDLPTRPTKKSDTRAKNFIGESVEVDAVPPSKLRELVTNVIEQHVDEWQLERMQEVEAAERETLQTMIENMQGGNANE